MGRSHYVDWGGRLVPRRIVEPDLSITPGVCRACDGLGAVPETIDEERYDVMVPCHFCRVFCKLCDRYVAKTGHQCKGKL
jgi:hypothetical protein